MDNTLEEICISLEDLAQSILQAYSDDRTLLEIWGWNCPSLNRIDLARMANTISEKIRALNLNQIDETTKASLIHIPQRIRDFKSKTLAYLFNGHAAQAGPAYCSLIEWINTSISPIFSWEVLADNKAIPSQLSKRLKGINAELNEIVPDKTELEERIKLIKDATETAESLPADMEDLKAANLKVNKLFTDSSELYGKIDTIHKKSESQSVYLDHKKTEVDSLVSKCEEAYRITTTQGLAASFEKSASRLRLTMLFWIIGLLVSLIAGAYISYLRFKDLVAKLQTTDPNWGIICLDLVISIIGLAGPIWFAWLATKQINQYFRLAEDYAFKASTAKAYEGYKKEAARIDETFENRLFASALDRFEEPPLRFLENDHHGSPWHEFFQSPSFLKAINSVPELKGKFISLIQNGKNVKKTNGVEMNDTTTPEG
jgi:hypothetical protein